MEYFESAMGVVGSVFKWRGANQQKRLDRRRTQLQYEDNLEKIRRRSFTQEQTKGRAKAYSEASGVLHSGGSSAQGALDTMAREFKYELDWMKKYAKTAKELGMEEANIRFKAGQMEAIGMFGSSIAKGVGSALG